MTLAPIVTFHGDRLACHFDRFDQAAYVRFLEMKRLPEYELQFHPETESYTITAPKRFATMLGERFPDAAAGDLPFAPFLREHQVAITRMALEAKRFACWAWIGKGKTLVQLEFARHAIHRTGGRALLVTMNEIVPQTIEECRKFYGAGDNSLLPVVQLTSRENMIRFARGEELDSWGEPFTAKLGVTNYEKFNPCKAHGQAISGVNLACFIVDENKLKGGGAKQKWAIIKTSKGIEYKLSCTATPAPNDTIEFASQASFLEKMRNDGEIIWTFFIRDEKTHRWTIKPHARKAFFEFMSSFSIYLKDERAFGWNMGGKPVPDPIVQVHEVAITTEQQAEAAKLTHEQSGQKTMFRGKDANAIERGKLSQLAKGFFYRTICGECGAPLASRGKKSKLRHCTTCGATSTVAKEAVRLPSLKPALVAELAERRVEQGLRVLVWTVFNEESAIVAEQLALRGVGCDLLYGATKPKERLAILGRFRSGECPILVSRANMLGFGMNFQHVGAMIFSGWNDSYEMMVQAQGRAVRDGQTRRVLIDIPVIHELEGDQLENVLSKEAKHFAAIDEMQGNYLAAMKRMGMIR